MLPICSAAGGLQPPGRAAGPNAAFRRVRVSLASVTVRLPAAGGGPAAAEWLNRAVAAAGMAAAATAWAVVVVGGK